MAHDSPRNGKGNKQRRLCVVRQTGMSVRYAYGRCDRFGVPVGKRRTCRLYGKGLPEIRLPYHGISLAAEKDENESEKQKSQFFNLSHTLQYTDFQPRGQLQLL